MAPCLVMGESAGVATAMAARDGVSMPELDIDRLQDVLRRNAEYSSEIAAEVKTRSRLARRVGAAK